MSDLLDRGLRRVAGGYVKFLVGGIADDEAVLLASTENVDRAGDVVVQRGIDYRSWLALGGVILWNHDAALPVGNAISASIEAAGFTVPMRFAPVGTSDKADEVRRLVKNGVVAGVSIGFMPKPKKWEWIDSRDPSSGIRFREIEIYEISLCSVPANRESIVVGKHAPGAADLVDYPERLRQRRLAKLLGDRSTGARLPPRGILRERFAGTLADRDAQVDRAYPGLAAQELEDARAAREARDCAETRLAVVAAITRAQRN